MPVLRERGLLPALDRVVAPVFSFRDEASRIGLLMVGHVDPKSQCVGGDYPELFGSILSPLGIELVRYDLDEGHFPDAVDERDRWLCSPSRLSTYDDVAWLSDAEELLRRIVAAEVPYVGIGFGDQLLAQALGGKVERSTYGWGVGARTCRPGHG